MKRFLLALILLFCLFVPTSALAQSYYFSLDKETVHAYWNDDGTLAVAYEFVFSNQPSGHPIEYVDVGLPNNSFSSSEITAEVNGHPLSFVSTSEYQGRGTGVAVGLGDRAIPPGGTGTVRVFVPALDGVLHPDTLEDDYASAVFAPTWFDGQYVTGTTDFTVTFHLPPGVEPEEPRWHSAPQGFSQSPLTALDSQGRITYTWRNPQANAYTEYEFGASFPSDYVPASAVSKPTIWEQLNINPEAVRGMLCTGSFFLGILLIIILSVRSTQKRKMKYLPPKIRVEGHGIKRGLTAIEAAVLLEKPVDKILTMILFSLLQKGAAEVLSREPLKLKFSDPLPDKLRAYEEQFIEAFQSESDKARKTKLQDLMIDLIDSVGEKMKGFSHKETTTYYQKIIKQAWNQVESAETPEVKSERFNSHMGWTMLDSDFEDRTQETFRRGPVYVPLWWHRYDPAFGRSASTTTSPRPSAGSSGGKGAALPNLPGGTFAASMVNGIQNFSSDVVGNVTGFTNRITQKTNPVPKSSSSGGWSSGSGGSSCACACACAGCACACAGGGR
ncbi:MAG: hypothetical protein U5K99_07125 [Anaerolineales bacterium]|nr:hypothetical protein [Anaerolineales bacterium]